MDPEFLEKFTSHLKSVLVRAYTLAHELGETTISIEHVLWSVLTERGSIGAEILNKVHLSADRVRERIATQADPQGAAPSDSDLIPKLSDDTKRAIEKAVHTAHAHEHKYVGTEHLLSAMIGSDNSPLARLFADEQVNLESIKEQLAIVLKSTTKFPELTGGGTRARTKEEAPTTRTEKKKQSKTPALDFFAVDLTSPSAQKRIDPVVGRAAEIERVMEILCRRTKNNPLLIGEPGVGKTAIVEGLATRVVNGSVPDVLRKKRILALDLALVVAGTMYRGEFEGRLKQIIDEVRANQDIILFLDEAHTITGAGSASGSLDAANILKPALARGDIHCIGATTYAEYKKHIESDAALDRRFQSVEVREPSTEETRRILEGIVASFARFHRVTVEPDALNAAVDMAERYVPDRRFPDKAIDLLDEACAAVRVRAQIQPALAEQRTLEAAIDNAQRQKQEAVSSERYVDALSWKEKENAFRKRLAALEQAQAPGNAAPIGTVSVASIADIVARMTGIPARALDSGEQTHLLDLEKELSARIVGQDAVIHGVADAIRRARVGLSAPGRPMASFLFLGPSGVGKTELAKHIARTVFQDPTSLVRLDMSEFGESFTVSKLLGSPAGYVGYRDSNTFTDAVRRRPYSVVLFDEVEKAHPDVLNTLLQILEDGVLTDSIGRKVSFAHTVIILTSNVGLEKYMNGTLGFASVGGRGQVDEMDIRKEALTRFRPELINRIDHLFVFRPLERGHLSAIVAYELQELTERLLRRGIKLSADAKAIETLADTAHAPEKGARAIRAIIQEQVEAPAAKVLLTGTRAPRHLKVTVKDGLLVVQRAALRAT